MKTDHWKAACSVPSQQMAKIVRGALSDLGYVFHRDKTYKNFTRFAIILPVPEAAYTFRFWVESPSGFVIDLYTTRPTHSGIVHFFEVHMVEDWDDVRRFMRRVVRRMPRKPWKITLLDRFKYGFLVPEFITAKRRWRKVLELPKRPK